MSLRSRDDLTLILNASEGCLQIVLARATDIYISYGAGLENHATELFAPVFTDLLHTLHLKLEMLQRLACVCGPGSFTGIRLVLTTALALRRSCGMLVAGLNYLQALAVEAQMLGQLAKDTCIYVVTHARQNLVHLQSFTVGDDCVQPTSDISLVAPTHMATLVKPKSYVIGSGLLRNSDLINALKKQDVSILALSEPSPKALVELATRAQYSDEDLTPLYVRPCDALTQLDSLCVKQGLSPSATSKKVTHLLHEAPRSFL
ncbi:MAG: tRNA (adenosine(37)-N6)-threonylcarbamoyltransferase complex dimerization subunit type 1 TsaB [Desulfovibrionaceae bacterium]|nr:tRNA (adenosine(37)-N6)-threonylcarbamoyltransferase complex dimerization subunit type 1 TsaB [Desulfovibrionaceae bacterium]